MPAAQPATESAIASSLAQIGAQVLVRGWLSANNIVFRDGPEGASVVDTGYFSHAAQTLALVEHALAGGPLAMVVNTHLHSDHCGGNATLARRWPASRLVVPAGYRAHLEPWNEAETNYQATDQQCEPFTPQAFVKSGDHLRLGGRDWQVHAAPGHDPDAVLLFEPGQRHADQR